MSSYFLPVSRKQSNLKSLSNLFQGTPKLPLAYDRRRVWTCFLVTHCLCHSEERKKLLASILPGYRLRPPSAPTTPRYNPTPQTPLQIRRYCRVCTQPQVRTLSASDENKRGIAALVSPVSDIHFQYRPAAGLKENFMRWRGVSPTRCVNWRMKRESDPTVTPKH
ncbi:hypothetical protein B0T16DRAFT_182011 [Cercophora newfieldiana]|uniref:Uncharacterized protein n=1 Tax=Cercophora newfieldiana TaxID=92897 RepID=A0AA39Y135_9PEZI|nr:hypothetical protein B0T16DRAFT_182011 [Cercophora newfieldiana]